MENKEFHTYELPNGDLIIQINKVRDGWNSIDSKWVYITSNKSYSFPMHYNLYSGAELRSLLIKSGFKNVRLYGDIKGSHYDQNAKRLVAVGDKKY